MTAATPPSTSVTVPSNLTYRLSFSSDTVKKLGADDFDLDSRELITLKYDDCILVLFYSENIESHQLANLWAMAAQQIAGPVFAAINLVAEKKVAAAFTRLKSDGSNPLHPFGLRQIPSIFVYRKKWPVAVYNGARTLGAIIDYSLNLACNSGYYEPEQLGGGYSVDPGQNLGMPGYKPYIASQGQPLRTVSTQFTAENPIRGFNSAGSIQQVPTVQGGNIAVSPTPPTNETINPVTGEPNQVAVPANQTS